MHYLIFDPTSNFYAFGDDDKELPDMMIFCQGYTFLVHRLLLQTWIPYFNRLPRFKEGKTDELHLNDEKYHPDMIHALLCYCHCRDLELEIKDDDYPLLIQHASYWEYDDFIVWLFCHRSPRLDHLHVAFQQLVTEEAKNSLKMIIDHGRDI